MESQPLPISMDYDSLRRDGIRELERLSGEQWTDFNLHDPGITLLEQLCYVLTDLGYRTAHDIPDLLAEGGADPYQSLHLPLQILTGSPVTPADLRRVVLDVEGVRNAWIEPATEDKRTLYYAPQEGTLHLKPDPLGASEPVTLKGLHRVSIDPDSLLGDTGARVARGLHECRGLCEDFTEVHTLQSQEITVEATVDIGPLDDTAKLEREIVRQIAEVISPPVRFRTLAEELRAGSSLDTLCEGPRLAGGFLPDAVLEHATRRTALNTSDLIRAIRDVPGVQGVSKVRLSVAHERASTWSLAIAPDKVAKLDHATSSITLRRGSKIVARISPLTAPAASPDTAVTSAGLDLPAGRDRHVNRYTSVQRHLPAIYGVGDHGLPDSAPPERKAQAKQLEAYLTFFDRIMARHLAELAQVKDLFSHDDEALEAGPPEVERRNRFLSHLLARFAETIEDHSTSPALARSAEPNGAHGTASIEAAEELARRKRDFLQRYPRLGGGRGGAFNYLAPASPTNRSALEQRIELKLGLTADERPLVVEHILLRPMEGDDSQTVPLVAASMSKDPYSLQLTFVLPRGAGRFTEDPAGKELRALVEQTIREETPAHLTVYVRWMSAAEWEVFGRAYTAWTDRLREYWAAKLNVSPDRGAPTAMTTRHIHVRSARDRINDLLGIGETYPLQDVSVTADQPVVGYGQHTAFTIEPVQEDVVYKLYDGNTPVAGCEVRGDSPDPKLPGPIITAPRTFRILATKLASSEREVFLRDQPRVTIGVNPTLRAYLIGLHQDPSDADPWIAEYRSPVAVKVERSQVEVQYQLVYAGPGGVEIWTDPVLSSGGDLELHIPSIEEDTVIRIHATSSAVPPETMFLKAELPLAVLANPSAPVSIVPAVPIDGALLVDPADAIAITISQSQASVTYRAYVRTLGERDFTLTGLSPAEILTVTVPASQDALERKVRMRRPARPIPGQEQPDYVPRGEPARGNGTALQLHIGALSEDSVLVIQAHKEHFGAGSTVTPAVKPGTSTLHLAQFVLLARPEPATELTLTVTPSPDGQRGVMMVSGGQCGVFYHVRANAGGQELGLPAYFHRLDELEVVDEAHPQQNRGIEQLEIDRDLVIARVPDSGVATDRPELTPPPNPLVDIEPLPGREVSVMAVKVRTGVAWSSSRLFPVIPKPTP